MKANRREFLKVLGLAAAAGPAAVSAPAVQRAGVELLNFSVYEEVIFPAGKLHGEQELLYSGPFLDETKFLINNLSLKIRGNFEDTLALVERGNIQVQMNGSKLPLLAARFIDCPNIYSLPMMLFPVMLAPGDSLNVKLVPVRDGWPMIQEETRIVVTLDGMMTRRVQ